jgi:hypothetical protein
MDEPTTSQEPGITVTVEPHQEPEPIAEPLERAALEDSMTQAAALQMTALETAIAEFKGETENLRGLCGTIRDVLSQVEDLKMETLELVEALQNADPSEGLEKIEKSQIQTTPGRKIIKAILA